MITRVYLRGLSEAERDPIEVVSIDPYEPYRQAIRTELSRARIVADRFHLVRGANTRPRLGAPRAPASAWLAALEIRWRRTECSPVHI